MLSMTRVSHARGIILSMWLTSFLWSCRKLAQVVREMQAVAAAGLKPSQHRALNLQGLDSPASASDAGSLPGTPDSEAASAADQQPASQTTSPTKQGQSGNATGEDTIAVHAADDGVVSAKGGRGPPPPPPPPGGVKGAGKGPPPPPPPPGAGPKGPPAPPSGPAPPPPPGKRLPGKSLSETSVEAF